MNCATAAAAGTIAPSSQPPTHQEVVCTLAGLDSVSCVITEEPDELEELLLPNTPGSAHSAHQGPGVALDTAHSPSGALAILLLVSPFFFWGTSMCVMKSVLAHTTPLMLGAMRLLPAGLALVAWAAWSGRPQPSGLVSWAWVSAFALVDAAAFQGFLAEGLQRTSAGLGSVIIDSQPLTVAVLAALLFGEALGASAILGLILGVFGLGLLEVPEPLLLEHLGGFMLPAGEQAQQATAGSTSLMVAQTAERALAGTTAAAAAAIEAVTGSSIAAAAASSSSSSWWSTLSNSGEFWMLLAAQSMAVGTVMVRYVSRHVDPIMATGWHMVLGGALLAAAGLAADGTDLIVERFSQFDASDAASMAYVSLLGGAAGYGIFFYNASRGSLTALSSLTFLTPVFAAGTGYLALGETLTPLQLAGGLVTLAAVGLINTKQQQRQQQQAPSRPQASRGNSGEGSSDDH